MSLADVVKHTRNLLGPGDIGDEIIAIDPLRDRLGVLFVAGMDDHLRTFSGKRARDSQADIIRGSSYQRDFIVQ
jgi:hypothetical protein